MARNFEPWIRHRVYDDFDPRPYRREEDKKMVTVEALVQRIIDAIAEEYCSDVAAPALVITQTREGNYEVRILRAVGVAILAARGPTLLEALSELARTWLAGTSPPRTARDALRDLVR